MAPGVRLGAYEIIARIGAGGMGEVYRARDTRLNRIVAIKILAERSASDPEFRERFEREARAISSLEHPNICALYDVGEHEGVSFLVMQHLDGETLEARLLKGALPLDQALRCAIEITDALDKAHHQGIIHRDLKPGNIMLTPSGAKLLDFGLAKAAAVGVAGELSMLPTTPPNLTAQGAILGTFQYMAPEQLEGAEADTRSDIFSFGVVLYEMVSGKRPFEGKSRASLIAAILEHEPTPVSSRGRAVPRFLEHIVTRCLAKNPEARWQSARDLCDELRWAARDDSPARGAAGAQAPSRLRQAIPWALAALAVAASAAAVLYVRPAAPAQEMRLDVAIPMGSDLSGFTLSPDGERLVAAVATDGQRRLWLRSISSGAWRPLNGTEGAGTPFWSPDSRSVAFVAGNNLKRIDVDGGVPQTLGDASPRGGSWNRDGVLLYAQNVLGPLVRAGALPSEQPVPVTTLQPLQTAHVSPFFLADGRRFLYYAQGPVNTRAVYLASLDSPDAKRLTLADNAAVYVPGWLLYVNQSTLRARRFDMERGELSGDEISVANSVSTLISVSDTGLIAYRTESTRQTQLMWADRSGRHLGPFGPSSEGMRADPQSMNLRRPTLSAPRLSPDAKRAALFGGENGDIYLIDQNRVNRFTFDTAGDRYPIWSPDGRTVVFDSRRPKGRHLFQSGSSGGEELLLATEQDKTANDYSSDGRFILFQSNDEKTGIDLWVLPLQGKRQPYIFRRTPFNERRAAFSPDGRWVTYLSNESGRYEVYVRPFFEPDSSGLSSPAAGASSTNWQISTTGGIQPRWSPDGKEIFYVNPEGKLMAVPVKVTGGTLEAGAPVALFAPRILGIDSVDAGLQYDVAQDGRFLLNTVSDDASPITVVVNWTPDIQK